MGSLVHRRGLALSLAALAVVLLLLGVTAGHVHEHGPKAECPLCQAVPHPELLDLVSLLEVPQCAMLAATPPLTDLELILVQVGSSISFRGPPTQLTDV